MSRKRAVIAGLLGAVYPGLGHVYLREWVRAGTWFVLAIVTVAIVLPESVIETAGSGGLDGIIAASRNLPSTVVLVVTGIRLLNAIDAIWLALSASSKVAGSQEGATCQNCGGELDPDLEFCPWCSTEVAAEAAADGGGPTSR